MPFWTGQGRTLPDGVIAWSWSVLSPAEDRTWNDDAGNAHGVGNDKVSHIWALRTGGQRITFMDPWLANDDSYEMCAPRDGRFRSVNLSASGSTVFVIGRHGDLYTRLFDFDISGSDDVFFDYSYEPQRKGDPQAKIQLPSPAWVHQPKVPGRITSAISISKEGTGGVHRTLRVEGVDARGRTGYWEKDITARSAKAWRFHRTGRPLSGPLLRTDPTKDTSALDLGPKPGVRYRGTVDGVGVTVDGFDPHCSPARLTLTSGGRSVNLILHAVDGMRGEVRGPQLDDRPRGMYGDIEVPRRVLAGLDRQPAAIRRLIESVLQGKRFTDVPLVATTHELTFDGLGWTLRR